MCKLDQLMSSVISFCYVQPDWLGLLVEYACRYPAFDQIPLFLSSAINCSWLTDDKEIFFTCWALIMLHFNLLQALPIHVNFEVSITSSWVVEEWNGLESSHPYFSCSKNLSFWKIFKLKHSFAPRIILLYHSMCIVPYCLSLSYF